MQNEISKQDVEKVMVHHQDLCSHGWRNYPRFYPPNFTNETAEEFQVRLERGRSELLSEDSIKQINASIGFLMQFATPRKTQNKSFSSYGLKHDAEAWAGLYITNGALVAAALILGYRAHPNAGDPNNINCHFNMKVKRIPRVYRT